MSTDEMRQALKRVYPGPKWSHKVDQMNNEQVIAVYVRLKQQNKL